MLACTAVRRFSIVLFQQRLLLPYLKTQVGREEIGELFRVVDPEHERARLLRDLGRPISILFDEA